MTTDRYTKVVLTIIAVSLATIALQHAIPSAFAQSDQVVRVAICDPNFPSNCARVTYSSQGFGVITFMGRN